MYIQPLARGPSRLSNRSIEFRIPKRRCRAPLAEELLTLGLAYGSRTSGVINMTAAGRLWLNQRAE
jgi:hypothetical protein